MLHHHAAAELGLVPRLVPVRVVGVHGVGHVGADTERRAARPLLRSLLRGARTRRERPRDAPHGVLRHGRPRPLRRVTAHLLVVEVHHHAHPRLLGQRGVRRGGHHGAQGGEATGQVIQAPREDEFAPGSTNHRGLHVAQLQLEVHDVPRRAPQLLGEHLEQDGVVLGLRVLLRLLRIRLSLRRRRRRRCSLFSCCPRRCCSSPERGVDRGGDHGHHVRLEVHLEAVAEGAVEVDGERRDAHDGPVNLHQLVRELRKGALASASTAHEHAAGDAQVAVKPGVPEPPAVVLDAHLEEAGAGRLGVGLELGARRVRVRADDDEALARCVLGTHGERGDGAHVAGEEILATGREAPRIALGYLLEARGEQLLARGEHGVVGRPRVVEVRHAVHRLLGGRRAGGSHLVACHARVIYVRAIHTCHL
mmetsp:Transcript_12076/g.29202  ORF Transcript_12076/g.29202 Transcript_12076/m.29202 type:complete len:421 (-) Transcript_12076:59-1321(-)